MRHFFSLLLLFNTLLGDVPLPFLKSDPLTHAPVETAFPKVDVISGTYVEDAIDLVVAGNHPLSLRRFYYHTAPTQDTRYGFWHINPEASMTANFEYGALPKFVSLGSFSGGMTQFSEINPQTFGLKANNSTGYTGQTHPLNTTIHYKKRGSDHKERFIWEGKVKGGSGTIREFKSGVHHWHKTNKKIVLHKKQLKGSLSPTAWIPYHLEIRKERQPNGNILVYDYCDWRNGERFPWPTLLKKITLYDRDEKEELASLTFKYEKYGWKYEEAVYALSRRDDYYETREDVKSFTVTGSDKRVVTYVNKKRKRDYEPAVLTVAKTPTDAYHLDYTGYYLKTLEKNGHRFKTEYDKQNRVTAQYSPTGLIAKYTYHPNMTEVTDGEGNTTRYYFDKRVNRIERENSIETHNWDPITGNLLSKIISDVHGNTYFQKTYTYDENHNPITETAANYTIYRTYSDDGFNPLLEEKEGDKITQYTYKPGTNLIESISISDQTELKLRTHYSYDNRATCIKIVEEDGKNFCKTTTIKPKANTPCLGLPEIVETDTEKTIYTYTPFGKILKEEHYDSTQTYRYSITHTYDEKERLQSTTNPLGETTTYSYDTHGNLTSIKTDQTTQTFTYDAANRPLTITNGDLTTHKRYDTTGRVISQIDPCGFETKYTYDGVGNITTILHPDGALEQFEYDPLGNVTKKIDPNGNATKTTYNLWGKPLTILHPDNTKESFTYNPNGTLASHTTPISTKHYTYDIFGNILKIVEGEKISQSTYAPYGQLSQTDPTGVRTTYAYDTLGRKISERIGDRITTYSYDTLGRLAETHCDDIYTIEEFDNLDRPISRKTNQTHEQFAYDTLGNQTQITNSKGSTTTHFNAQSKPLQTTDPLGKTTTYTYSYKGGLTIIKTEPNGRQTIIKHDSRGREIETLRENQHFTTTYDLNGNPLERTYNTTRHTWTYDSNNRITSLTEGGEKTTHYHHNEKGQLQTLIKPNATLHHTYDAYGRLATLTGPNLNYRYTYDLHDRLIKSNDGTTRTYDMYGNLIQERLANSYTLSSTYDPQGRRIRLTLPDQSHIDYTYNGPHLQTVSRKGQTHTYQRDLDGAITHSILPYNLGCIEIERDPLSRPLHITSPYYRATNTFDISNNLTRSQTTDPLGPLDSHYHYDSLDQLIEEENHTYCYDPLYNRIEKDGSSQTYNTLCQNEEYTYDSNGNLLSDGIHTYTYDCLDRLISIDNDVYTYDTSHRRVLSNQTILMWDGTHEIGSQSELRVLGEGLGSEIGAALFLEIKGKTYIPIHNTTGSLAVLINSKGRPQETYRYTAYGEELTTPKISPWRFASKRTDSTKLVYFGRRYYSPSQGRFITPDPLGFTDGPNLYAYVHNSPMTNIDMHGLLTCKDVGNGILNYEKGAFKHLWGAVEGVGQFANTLGGWMIADSLYEMGDTSYFHAKSQASLDDWKAFGSAFAKSPIRTSGKMLVPGVMAALDSPTSAEAWGRAGVDIGLLALSFTKIGQIGKLSAVENKALMGSRAGGVAERFSVRKGTYGELRRSGTKDAHHIIQDAAVRDLPNYSRNRAPSVQLPGPSTRVDTPHYAATKVQRQSGGGTYAAERRIAYKALRRSGMSSEDARSLIQDTDRYFESIGVSPNTMTRIPGNR
ncbi:MAG: hypothetical protein S4CHLAM45_13340 [Chlamydiales bacterium]|nr:hypothetical protein [Chlamydiales bacterium]MCH9620594.1 hypothetical protein [Chlamydiales bacterium]MCH9623424.1 hypothetical protein [Chlamydiales bacterium]